MIKDQVILVTGGAGFIGANLIRRLLKEKKEVHIILKKQTNLWRLKDVQNELHLHCQGLNDQTELARLVKRIRPEIIFHLAAYGSYPLQTDLFTMIQTNIVGTANLLKAANQVAYSAFINTGSSSEYGFKKKPMRETDLLEPTSFYAATKASATFLCQVFAKTNNKPIVTLRPFSIYGPWEEPSRLVPTTMKACFTGGVIRLAPGKIRRDFVFVDDMIDAYFSAAQSGISISGEVINIGTGKQYTNEQVVSIIAKVAKKNINIEKGTYKPRPWDTDYWVADWKKAKKLLNWKPKYSLRQGLAKTLEWFKENLSYYQQ